MKTPFFIVAVLLGLLSGCATKHPEPEPIAKPAPVAPSSSPGSKFALLPSAVQSTIRAQAGAAEITDINKITGADRDTYEITFRDNPTLFVAADGSVVNGSATGAIGTPLENIGVGGGQPVSSLPYPVQQTLARTAPGAPVAQVQQMQRTVYEITFSDPQHPKIFISEDGTILKDHALP